jgi:hypothetical protein
MEGNIMNSLQIFTAMIGQASKYYDDANGINWITAAKLVDEAAMLVVNGKISMIEAEIAFSKNVLWNVTKGQFTRRVNAMYKKK